MLILPAKKCVASRLFPMLFFRPGVSILRSANAMAFRQLCSPVLPNPFRQRAVVADDVGKLRAGDVNAQPLVHFRDVFDTLYDPGFRLLAPADGRAEDLAAPQFATLRTGALERRIE